ncbi:MAG: RsmE family RNA methyltransferase [Bacteroidales bacterium]|nr:RsmE family RNA methyltransferase [Bacteroidales bacterium]
MHLFYAPEIAQTSRLPEDEAAHAIRVLRMKEGDQLWATDGEGCFYDCTISLAGSGKHPQCCLAIEGEKRWQCPWDSAAELVVAPTKNMDRLEWLAEKATEIGLNAFHFVDCANSERRVLKTERLERIVVSATKQSHKALKPTVKELRKWEVCLAEPFDGDRFIAHCYSPEDISANSEKPFLLDVVRREVPTQVWIGPEGDFSIEEVRAAEAAGFRSVSLGESRLRTETAALVAVHLMNLKKTCG